jgi:hypothetical protein
VDVDAPNLPIVPPDPADGVLSTDAPTLSPAASVTVGA